MIESCIHLTFIFLLACYMARRALSVRCQAVYHRYMITWHLQKVLGSMLYPPIHMPVDTVPFHGKSQVTAIQITGYIARNQVIY